MKKVLLVTAAMLAGSVMLAQVDLTPERFVFANQAEGQYTISYYNSGANPSAGAFEPAVENADNGFLVVCAGPANVPTAGTEPSSAMLTAIQKYTHIVDLGGEVGKVLCLKGPSSTAEYGPEADGSWLGWYNMNFYMKKTGCVEEQPIRTRLVFSVIGNDQEATDDAFKFYCSSYQNDAKPQPAISGRFSPYEFAKEDPEYPGELYYDDNGMAVYDATKWMVYEFDYTIGTDAGIPARLKMEMQNNVCVNYCVLIKELTFTMNPTGDPVEGEFVTYTPGNSSVGNIAAAKEASFKANGNQVEFFKAGSVYTIGGAKVAKAVGGQTITLDRGIYVVKAGNKAQKLIVR